MARYVLDSNAYRNLVEGRSADEVEAHVEALRESERGRGEYALASTLIVDELLAHVADGADASFSTCARALFAMAQHCRDDDGKAFRLLPAISDQSSPLVASGSELHAICEIARRDRGVASSELMDAGKQAVKRMSGRETAFVNDHRAIATMHSTKEERRRLVKDLDSMTDTDFACSLASAKFAMEGRIATAEEVDATTKEILRDHGPMIASHRRRVKTSLEAEDFDQLNVGKMTNDLWDMLFVASAGAELDGAEIYVVSDDNRIAAAATSAGKEEFVLELATYQARINAS